MKTIMAAFAALLAFALPAFAQGTAKPKTTLNAEVLQNCPDQLSGSCTPFSVRQTFNDLIASSQQAPQVNAQVGASYTFLATDYGKLVTFNNAGAVAVTLPQGIGSFNPWNATVLNQGAGLVTITPQGGSTIAGNSTLTLSTNQGAEIVSDGTNYQVAIGTGNSSLANMAANTVKCNPTSSSAPPLDCQSGVLHSKDFGAFGDAPAHDDTTALQNWINACQTNKVVCHLDPGTYKTTTALSCTPPLVIEGNIASGNDSSQSILQPATNINGINCTGIAAVIFRDFMISYPSAASATVSAITLTASGASAVNYGSRFDRLVLNNVGIGVNVGQAEFFTFSNVIVQNITGTGIGFNLDNTGLTLADTGDSKITHSTISSSSAFTGVNIPSFAGLNFIDNKINANGSSAVGVSMPLKNGVIASDLTIAHNSIEGVSVCYQFSRAGTTGTFTTVDIADNNCNPNSGGAGLNVPTDANGIWLFDLNVHDNHIFGPSTTSTTIGYIIKAATNVQLQGNLTHSNSSTNGFVNYQTTGSTNCTIGPNAIGTGLFAANDLGCTTLNNYDGPWRSFTLSPVCGSATFTTNSARFTSYGKTTNVEVDFTITALGTCTNGMSMSLPNTSNSSGSIVGRESAVSGKGWACSFTGSTTTAGCALVDATGFANGARMVASGTYENQ